jgi:hypothetical protein
MKSVPLANIGSAPARSAKACAKRTRTRQIIRRNRGTLAIRFTGRSSFQPAMVRTYPRACALSVMPAKRRRSSTGPRGLLGRLSLGQQLHRDREFAVAERLIAEEPVGVGEQTAYARQIGHGLTSLHHADPWPLSRARATSAPAP